MNPILTQLLSLTDPSMDYTHRVRESIQRIALYSLSQTSFFDKAAFVGGTALRLFHDLDRFSEDLDFTLLQSDADFTFEPFMARIMEDFAAFDLNVEVKEKTKSHVNKMKSAFIKGNSKEMHLQFGIADSNFQKNERLTIKLEVDIDPPEGSFTEWKNEFMPYPHNVRLYDLPTMHACKLHAILCRNWGNRVKGRDYYDILYYAARRIPVNTKHLINRLAQSDIDVKGSEEIREMLIERCEETDYISAIEDVDHFVLDKKRLENWSPELFVSAVKRIKFI